MRSIPRRWPGLLDGLFPNSELVVLGDEAEMLAQLPMLVQRVREFLAG